MSLETIVQNRMDGDKFHLLMDILKILERHKDPKVQESVIEIIDNFNDAMTSEQKAAVLKAFLNFKHRDDEQKRRFDEEVRKQQMREFFSGVHYD